jgi:hypothetical protein
LLHTGSWVYLNSNRDTSYEFVKGVMRKDIHNSVSYYDGYRLAPWYALTWNVYHDVDESVRALNNYLSRHPNDRYRVYQLAGFKNSAGSKIEAAELLKGKWNDFVADSETILDIASIFRDAGWSRDQEAVLEAYVRAHGYQGWPTYALADAKRERGELDSAWTLMSMAMTRADSLTDQQKLNYALFALELGKREVARVVLANLVKSLPSAETKSERLMIEAIDRNDTLQIDSLKKALSLKL